MVERLRMLMRWREYIGILRDAIREILPGCNAYVIGGAAENRLTAKSDIDVLIVCENPPRNAYELAKKKARIREILEEKGIEWSYLFEFHIVDKKTVQKYLQGKPRIKIT